MQEGTPPVSWQQPRRVARPSAPAGLDRTRLTYFHGGRDMRLTDVSGRVIQEVIA